ncbi:hypothetical protein M9434_002669 [Picochlorum sp. BPE23]|nr:hypothetical protein M9434_002669 [Picochlorum sp. BPE23]
MSDVSLSSESDYRGRSEGRYRYQSRPRSRSYDRYRKRDRYRSTSRERGGSDGRRSSRRRRRRHYDSDSSLSPSSSDSRDYAERDRTRKRHRKRDGPSKTVPSSCLALSDDIHKVAGKIAWSVRRNEVLKPLFAHGIKDIMKGLEIIAIARGYLGSDQEPGELMCQPSFYKDVIDSDTILFHLRSSKERKTDVDSSDAEFVTSSRSKVTSLAGAIAGRARDQNTGALVEAIGEDAVATMVKAMAKARVFLEKDAIDLAVVITTEEVEKKGVDRVQRVLKNFRGKCYLEKCNM